MKSKQLVANDDSNFRDLAPNFNTGTNGEEHLTNIVERAMSF